VQYDHFSGGRFRHGTKFLRWRPEKKPSQCTFEQVQPARKMNAPILSARERTAAAKSDAPGSKTKVA
jgi:ATP-dependent DNA ligase